MRLIKTIPIEETTEKILNDLSQFGFTLVYSEGMIKIYKERMI
jgi:hypothetical protein